MNDKELLELAAKAAGGEIATGLWNGGKLHIYTGEKSYTWNPLTDDGDALRLAVKIRRMPVILQDGNGVMVGYERKRNSFVPIIETFGDDENAATRRAIVRAAAEIAKAMP